MCGCKPIRCPNKECRRWYPKEEIALTECPDCGHERYCTNPRIKDPHNPDKWLPCRFHGGHSHKNRGAASSVYKDGKYSKYMPTRLLEAYDASRDDPEILSLNEDIALTEARVADVLQRVDTNESGAMWDELAKLAKDIKAARKLGDPSLVEDLFDEMVKLIQKGKGDRENWREIGDLLERKRKLSESQLKLLVTKQEFISRQQAVMLVGQLVEVVKANVDDPLTKKRIAAGISQLMNMQEGQQLVRVPAFNTHQERRVEVEDD